MKKLILSLTSALMIVSCNSNTNTSTQPISKTNVFVYIIGSDLESGGDAATSNIKQMMQVGSNENLNVIIETGGAKKDKNDLNIDWSHVQRYKVNKGSLQLLQDLGDDSKIDMGTGSSLKDFIVWANSNYSQGKNILVLWDHGGGPNGGIGPDEITNSVISMPSILQAINDSKSNKFEIIGFDACLMGSVEIASGLVNYSNFMVASEDLEPGAGWDYSVWLKYIQDHPNAHGDVIGKSIADGFLSLNKNDAITLSVIKLADIPKLVSLIGEFSKSLNQYAMKSTKSWETIAEARVRSIDFATSAFFKNTQAVDLVDMVQFINNTQEYINKNIGIDQKLTDIANQITDLNNNLVTYQVTTLNNVGATGLSIYYPSVMSTYVSKNYQENTTFDGKLYFSDSYITKLIPDYYNYYQNQMANLVASVSTLPIDPNNKFLATIQNNYDIAMVGVGSSTCAVFLPGSTSATNKTCISGIKYIASSSHDQSLNTWSFEYDKNDEWPSIKGSLIALIPDFSVYKKLASNGYIIPAYIKHEEGYSAGYLRVEEENGLDKIVGFQPSETNPNKTYPLTDGTVIALGVYAELGNNDWRFVRGENEFTYDSNVSTIGKSPAPSSIDEFTYIVNDLTGNISVGNLQNY